MVPSEPVDEVLTAAPVDAALDVRVPPVVAVAGDAPLEPHAAATRTSTAREQPASQRLLTATVPFTDGFVLRWT
jgi:hypothetical protein